MVPFRFSIGTGFSFAKTAHDPDEVGRVVAVLRIPLSPAKRDRFLSISRHTPNRFPLFGGIIFSTIGWMTIASDPRNISLGYYPKNSYLESLQNAIPHPFAKHWKRNRDPLSDVHKPVVQG